jgi:hypothetical protein
VRPSTARRVVGGTVAETQRQAWSVTLLVLVILAVMWAAVLLPPWLRGRTSDRPSDSIHSFRRQLSVLERATPGLPGQQRPESLMTLSEAQRRRRLIIGVLGMLAGATLLGAFTSSGSARMGLLALNLVFDAALVGYLLLLAQARQVAAEREMKVRYLRTAPAPGTQLAQAERLEIFEHSAR